MARKLSNGELPGWLDKWVSRKLTMPVVATVLLHDGMITEQTWMVVVGIYVLAQGLEDVAERLSPVVKTWLGRGEAKTWDLDK